jgi:hypothetical protein
MNYWLDLFTGETWREYIEAGGRVSGFRHRMRKTVASIQPGDVLLCYLTGVMRWIGALRVVGPSADSRGIWKLDDFPARLAVEPMVVLEPETGIPMEDLEGRLLFYSGKRDRGGFRGFLRSSPNLFKRQSDGDLILSLMREAEKSPTRREVDLRKLNRKPYYKVEFRKGKTTVDQGVSIPGPEPQEPAPPVADQPGTATTRHTEIQHALLRLGAELGLDVWVARNDRSRMHNGEVLGGLPRILDELPTQFNEATTRTIELIDVLWLQGNSIVAAFEVEATTSVYSGLLRMSDLLALQPNLEIQLFLVAPEDRRDKVEQEIRRPTFAYREKPLPRLCGFLPFGKLTKTVDSIRGLGLAGSLKPDFLRRTAEYFAEDAF